MDYRLNKDRLLEILGEWNRFLKRKVHLIACGGTAMTLLGVKPTTKDVDFEDCLNLVEAHHEALEIDKLIRHFCEMVRYDVAEHRLRPNINHLLGLLKEKGLYG